MTTGFSIFLIALGAILKYAVTTTTEGFSIATAGTILMVVGVIGLLISLYMMAMATRRGAAAAQPVVRERDVY